MYKYKIDSQLKVNVDYEKEEIELETTNSITNQIYKEVLKTKEDAVRKALISLGWTPPDETSNN